MLSYSYTVRLCLKYRSKIFNLRFSEYSNSVSISPFNHITSAPSDKILGLNETYNKDPSSTKINLIVGAYRDNNGKPVVLDSVREAERRIYDRKENHEYAGIDGIAKFIQSSCEFAYGKKAKIFEEKRIAALQTLSGTGACRVAADFIAKFSPKNTNVYLPDPTWANHVNIFRDGGIEPKLYKYYDYNLKKFDFDGMRNSIQSSPKGSWFLLHACAHNPTGYDPTKEQWRILSNDIKSGNHFVLFDCAYQGFASGNADNDAFAVRHFVEEGHCIMLAQSFAKNFGLYGERIGTLSYVAASPNEGTIVASQLKRIARAMYSNPPIYGAKVVSEILSDPTLKSKWELECKGMADRIIEMRKLLRQELEAIDNSRDWSHITTQIGMFSFLGLEVEQVLRLREEFHIYFTDDSRISIAGVTSSNAKYIAESIKRVITSS